MNLDWSALWAALALVLILEGLLPFLAPGAFRRSMAQVAQLPDRPLRALGLVSMLIGLLLLYWVR
ncbi:MAG: DUF2065 domain-containing protein [Halofilum sp. (in: g-proteobacteria)]